MSAIDLLRNEGSVEVPGIIKFPKRKVCVFHVATEDFWFNLGFLDGDLVLQRTEFILHLTEKFFHKLPNNHSVIASWMPLKLIFLLGHMGFVGQSYSKTKHIEFRPPPPSLFRWARTQSLLPQVQYDSEAAFVSRVHAGLSLIQDKIDELSNHNIFFNLQYEGNRIIRRDPKRETELVPIIQGLLSDQFFISSIDVFHEQTTGAGRIDFLLVASVSGIGISKVCVEFKLADSPQLQDGIEHQLPAYMRHHNTNNGTYCILDFSPPALDVAQIHQSLARAAKRGWGVRSHPIKVHHFYLGNRTIPSII